jgi:hypothetical protein
VRCNVMTYVKIFIDRECDKNEKVERKKGLKLSLSIETSKRFEKVRGIMTNVNNNSARSG